MKKNRKAPAGQGGRGIMVDEVFSHGVVERRKRVIRPRLASQRKYGGRKTLDRQ